MSPKDDPFKDHAENISHKGGTKNNNHSAKLPYMKTKIGKNCVATAGGRSFYDLAFDARKIESIRAVFILYLNKQFLSRTLCIISILLVHHTAVKPCFLVFLLQEDPWNNSIIIKLEDYPIEIFI